MGEIVCRINSDLSKIVERFCKIMSIKLDDVDFIIFRQVNFLIPMKVLNYRKTTESFNHYIRGTSEKFHNI